MNTLTEEEINEVVIVLKASWAAVPLNLRITQNAPNGGSLRQTEFGAHQV